MRDHAQPRVLSPNDPCWCGSGRKFKKCHMGREEAPATGKRNPLVLNEAEREGMRKAGRANAELLDHVRDMIRPGLSTSEINKFVHEWTIGHGYRPATLGYRNRRGLPDFPASCCTSPNHVVCHGIPGDYVLQEGDIINVDLTTVVDGWHGDQSETFFVGAVSDEALELVQCSFDSMWAAIDAIRPYSKVIEIGRVISHMAKERGFSVVKEYQGHGVGREFHQKPHVPHFPDPYHGQQVLEPGMCFTIEPMINQGTWKTVMDRRDGWTVYTADGKLSAQFEHTILMTESGPEVLTLAQRGPRRGHKFVRQAVVA